MQHVRFPLQSVRPTTAATPCSSASLLRLAPQDLGAAALSKRPTSCMLVLPKPLKAGKDDKDDSEAKEFAETYAEAEKKVRAAMPAFT